MQTLTILSLVLGQLTASVLTDRITVDDSASTWTYSLGWRSATASTPCTTCTAQPDPARALSRTWHDTVGPGYADLSFTGISIEVYTICPDRSSSYGTYLSFSLDNVADGTFIGPRPACTRYIYNYLVYARANLSLAEHKLRVTNADPTQANFTSNLLLDYAIYDDGTASSRPGPPPAATPVVPSSTASKRLSLPLAAIVAPAAAAGVLLLVMILQILYHLRSRKRPMGTPREGSFDHSIRSKQEQSGTHQPLLGFHTEPLMMAQLGARGYTGQPVIMPGSPAPDDGYNSTTAEVRSMGMSYPSGSTSNEPASTVPDDASASIIGSGVGSSSIRSGFTYPKVPAAPRTRNF